VIKILDIGGRSLYVDWIDWTHGRGNSYGYATHQMQLWLACEKLGLRVGESADIAFHIKPICHYKRIPDKVNVVYSMYEYDALPDNWIGKLPDIDMLIVPCEHNRELFQKYTDKEVFVCPEGVDTDRFKYRPRVFPIDRLFRFYWFGVNNPRKGWPALLVAWDKILQQMPQLTDRVELYLKACNGNEEKIQVFGNVIFDNRTLPEARLVDLYHRADCFVFPTMGEGWGLTLIQAAATGLPCIYTDYSGPQEYMDANIGYPVDYVMCNVATEERIPGHDTTHHTAQAAYCLAQSLIEQMLTVYNDYDEAAMKGARAAARMKEFSWEKSARRLFDLLSVYDKVAV